MPEYSILRGITRADIRREPFASYTVVTRPNTAVIFINTPSALHAVSARSPSLVSRRLVNIMGRIPRSVCEGLFEKRQKTDWRSVGRRALQRYRIAPGRF